MKQLILVFAVVALVGCGKEPLIADPIVEKAIRENPLYISSGALTEADLEKITHLNLYGNKLTEVPKELEKLTQLRVLNLYDNKLTDVKGLEKLTQLESLSLMRNQLTDVKGLEKLTQLKTLHFDGNKLTDVKGLEKLTKLTMLDLKYNPDLTKAQIAELQKALPNFKISSNAKK